MKNRKLTPAQVEMIRVNYVNKRMTIAEMARALEVHSRTIARVIDSLDIARPTARDRGEAYQVHKVCMSWGIKPEKLQQVLETLENAGLLQFDAAHGSVVVTVPAPADARIVKECAAMTEATWERILSDIVTARVAKAHNVHVQTAMLNIEKKVNKNAGE